MQIYPEKIHLLDSEHFTQGYSTWVLALLIGYGQSVNNTQLQHSEKVRSLWLSSLNRGETQCRGEVPSATTCTPFALPHNCHTTSCTDTDSGKSALAVLEEEQKCV